MKPLALDLALAAAEEQPRLAVPTVRGPPPQTDVARRTRRVVRQLPGGRRRHHERRSRGSRRGLHLHGGGTRGFIRPPRWAPCIPASRHRMWETCGREMTRAGPEAAVDPTRRCAGHGRPQRRARRPSIGLPGGESQAQQQKWRECRPEPGFRLYACGGTLVTEMYYFSNLSRTPSRRAFSSNELCWPRATHTRGREDPWIEAIGLSSDGSPSELLSLLRRDHAPEAPPFPPIYSFETRPFQSCGARADSGGGRKGEAHERLHAVRQQPGARTP
jgi:hypothetical protein